MSKFKLVAYKARLIALALLSATATQAFAITAPTDTTGFGYTLYDIGVNDILNGPIGFLFGVGLVGYSFSQLSQNWKLAGLGILGGSGVLQADTIVGTMGMLI